MCLPNQTSHTMETQILKCVVVGDKEASKTELLTRYTADEVSQESSSTVYGNYSVDDTIDGRPVHVNLWDTSGQEDYDRLRPMTYTQAHVFLLVFSVASPASFESVKTKWHPELKRHCPKTPIVLAGTHIDLREDKKTLSTLEERNLTPISYSQGLQMQKDTKAISYVECSAITGEGVKNAFEQAIRAALRLPLLPAK